MSYSKTTWVDDTTKYNATNMNKIEQGIYDADAAATAASTAAATAQSTATAAQTTANNASSAASTAQTKANNAQTTANSKYTKPTTGIPETDLATAVRAKLGGYPVVTTVTDWNQECRPTAPITPDVVIPVPTKTRSEEIRYVFTSLTTTAEFTAPVGYMISMGSFAGLSTGNTLPITGLTSGSIYEFSIIVLDASHIGLTMIKEWPTA